MVAAIATTGCGNAQAVLKSPPSLYHSEKNNACLAEAAVGGPHPPRKEITSRLLSSSLLSSSKSNSSCISTISSSSSSTSSSASSSNPRQSESVDRTSPTSGVASSDSEPGAARTVVRSTTRSLSVSFQGESFFFKTRNAKPTPRKPILECRKANSVVVENSQSDRWSTTRARESNSATRNMNFSADKEHSLLVTVRLLQHSLAFNEAVKFDIGDRTQSLDSESFSFGSNSSLSEPGLPTKVQAKPRGISVPARFRQENGWPQPHAETPPKMITGKQQQVSSTQLASSRFVPSPPCGPVKSSSPREVRVSRIRRNIMERYSNGSAVNAPSILSFASEVRRKKKGESRIEDAHLLRLFHNRYLQWRYINARAENSILTQMMNSKNNLYYAWMTISELRDSAMNKRIKLQVLRQNLKLASILKGQIACLEEWSTLDEDHETSLKGAIEALKASTLRLPVIGGGKVDIQEVKDAVNSAISVMQLTTASTCSLLSKVEGISALVAELAKTAAHEQALLSQSGDILSIVAALHVKQSSLQSCMLQLEAKTSLKQLQ